MPNATLTYGLLAALAIALVVAAVTDLRSRRIGNELTAAIALAAPLFWWASGLSLWPGAAGQLAVAAITFAICAGLFAIRAMGGGDVKLLAALALWIEPALFVRLILAMAVLGGVLTLLMLVAKAIRGGGEQVAVPYGVAIAIAGLWVIGSDALPAETFAAAMG
jgi:prepilin peptidase CpaA